MNSHDMENIKFLLNADEETIKDWYSKTTDDDHEYAFEIMKEYQLEMSTKLALLKMSDPAAVDDTSFARLLLGRYK